MTYKRIPASSCPTEVVKFNYILSADDIQTNRCFMRSFMPDIGLTEPSGVWAWQSTDLRDMLGVPATFLRCVHLNYSSYRYPTIMINIQLNKRWRGASSPGCWKPIRCQKIDLGFDGVLPASPLDDSIALQLVNAILFVFVVVIKVRPDFAKLTPTIAFRFVSG